MDFTYSASDEEFRHVFRSWLEANVTPNDRHLRDREEEPDPSQSWREKLDWYRKLAGGGWTCVHWPKEYGGRALSLLQSVIYFEELERLNLPGPYVGVGPSHVGPTLMTWGTEDQKMRFLPPIVSGDQTWAQGYSEPGAGSDLASLKTRAVEDGDYFVINGQKVWTSGARFADWAFVLCRTDPDAPKHRGISYILVDLKTHGITVRPLVQITGAQDFNEVFFDDVRVPRVNLVGEKNDGWRVAVTTLNHERNYAGAAFNFANLIDELANLAHRVERNGRPASKDTSVRQKIAQFKAEAEAHKYSALRKLTRALKGLPPGPESSLAKLVASDLNYRIQMFSSELLGSYSQLAHHAPMAFDNGRWALRLLGARALMIAGGTNEIQRNIIGERVLGLPKG